MFICAITKKCSEPKEAMIKVVVETRRVTYNNMDGTTSQGWEIVREIGVTAAGLASHLRESTHG